MILIGLLSTITILASLSAYRSYNLGKKIEEMELNIRAMAYYISEEHTCDGKRPRN